ncbi:amino acid permease [Sphingomonas sp. AAP5]|uniref:putative glutamine/gamma-aminobutyrate antiporter GadC n=1 Tax=Sphingomonas sp. AAP5 TaxID=1523415 RepID=UPI0010575947|nr:putative glutamine/gamma-aminobutyrate antiporter GadC [Sphingomonas sp. AAP5]QBM76796.1 amino acid permease [Sphingomonas sp. AAP5]
MTEPSPPAAAPGGRPKPAGWLAHGGQTKAQPKIVIGMMAFAIMNVTTIVSLRGMPAQAEYGMASIFYYLFAAIVFLVPVALVAAELAATFPKQGGVFRWIGEAFGPRWGFAAIYYQWQAVVIWFPTVLIFAAAALAYIWWPPAFDQALADNKLYTIVVLLAVYWFVTLVTFRGMAASTRLSSLGGLFGTIIPGAILIALGVAYVAAGKPMHLDLHASVIPDFSDFHNMVLAASVFLYFAGMEMQAVHVQDLKNPTRNYPLSVLIATVMVVVIFVLGTLAVGAVIPREAIDINRGLLVAYNELWAAFGLPWLGNVMAAMLAFGVLGQVSVIVAGPSTGLLAVGKAGYLPHILQQTNAHGIPVAILILQGLLVTLLCVAFTVLPSVESAYQLLSQMATIIYLVMYVLLYVAAIRLRYTQPDRERPFRIPGGNVGMWLVGLLGLAGALVALGFSFIPPAQISTGSPVLYVGALVVGSAVFLAIPFVIYAFHKPDWKAADSDFEPFETAA